jgi:hypothetical protein
MHAGAAAMIPNGSATSASTLGRIAADAAQH